MSETCITLAVTFFELGIISVFPSLLRNEGSVSQTCKSNLEKEVNKLLDLIYSSL